ncbi:dephospho-CoA kinase [Oculatella sp. LEGE 06141]|uniref:dephospho-CoA kinase n=1 Tax=Oculatella sp. LEGE 06141 TaxID=1828648 RepID=UPI00187E6C0A|nr:dephospho-CoA kinase [Oculatella sp. LEGE 06141]MBE9177445.1 dephospho-CoA kinase [Oculatella sp. LEGE 06141]
MIPLALRTDGLPHRVIGLTGGVGMGKTTVSTYLADRYQLPILDADWYAREAVEPGSTVLAKIVERYGDRLLQPDGRLHRQRLGEIVFADELERRWLEQQIHPYVRDRLETNLMQLAEQEPHHAAQSLAVLVIPLLFEVQMTDLVSEIWVISCTPEQQQARLRQRDRLTVEQIQARIDSQLPIAEKRRRADVILDNSSTLEALQQQVDAALAHRTN